MGWVGEYPSNVVIYDTSVLPTGRLRMTGSVQPPNPSIRPDDKRQRKRVPVSVVERLPGAAIVTAYVGSVGAGGDPGFKGIGP
jgi:hypothetical protein